ncbi:MAG TPA: PIN domain-containing protein [Acidimicrobiales bacterium]|nr:PIN domain-containing protein [Acidimicrobiales bacterium]
MLLVDTGVFVAAADLDDRNHHSCAALIETHPGPLVTTALVITEAGWLIRRQLDTTTEAAFYQAIAQGDITIETLTGGDWGRIAGLIDTYHDAGLDAADASIIAIAERLDQTVIATLDERDFRLVRPAHTDAFDLLPGPS